MPTARERAREAGLSTDINMVTYPTKSVENIADAASDIWEPIVKELLVVIDNELGSAPPYSIIREAREAVGYADSQRKS